MFMFALLMAMFPRHLPKRSKTSQASKNIALAALQQGKGKDGQPLTVGKSFNVEPLPSPTSSTSPTTLPARPTLKGNQR